MTELIFQRAAVIRNFLLFLKDGIALTYQRRHLCLKPVIFLCFPADTGEHIFAFRYELSEFPLKCIDRRKSCGAFLMCFFDPLVETCDLFLQVVRFIHVTADKGNPLRKFFIRIVSLQITNLLRQNFFKRRNLGKPLCLAFRLFSAHA